MMKPTWQNFLNLMRSNPPWNIGRHGSDELDHTFT